ncbi:hypothetical protein HMPREF1624_03994 [Sporothrix schenckii ATCC 58251]|uniref:DUF6546 domain-containing protein n=1 Tax=Sporothrix schenckii (strain ATCC 58251 / de Perez 2211183) TaxID=1391915 RepID=U7PVL7_SPOS1|nr:hypothetical protein HMPREF1624_03994 [Sporothrix schenckii ATCC 58251]
MNVGGLNNQYSTGSKEDQNNKTPNTVVTPRVLPTIEIIRHFKMTRRFCRTIHPCLLAQLVASCPSLQSVHLEQWRPVDIDNMEDVEHGYVSMFSSPLPTTLTSFCLYQDSHISMHNQLDSLLLRTLCRKIGRRLAQACRTLETVAVSFWAEADDFFRATQQTPRTGNTCNCSQCFISAIEMQGQESKPEDNSPDEPVEQWPRLRNLALTSSTLMTDSLEQVHALLRSAAQAAARMPALQTMEIWFAYESSYHASVFRFQPHQYAPTLSSALSTNQSAGQSANWRHITCPSLSFYSTSPTDIVPFRVDEVLSPSIVRLFQGVVDGYASKECSWGRRPPSNPSMPLTIHTETWSTRGEFGIPLDGRTHALDNMVLAPHILTARSRKVMRFERREVLDMM